MNEVRSRLVSKVAEALHTDDRCKGAHTWGHFGLHLVEAEVAVRTLCDLIAAEIETEGREATKWLHDTATDDVDRARLIGAEDAYKDAIRLVRSLGSP